MSEFLTEFISSFTFALTLAVMLVGLFGLVIPVFPGGVVIWLAALLYGLVSGFGTLGGWIFAIITLLMLVSAAADNVLMGARAHKEGASWRAIILALLAGLVGTIMFPPIGGLIAAPLALYLTEYIRLGDNDKAMAITRGLLIG